MARAQTHGARDPHNRGREFLEQQLSSRFERIDGIVVAMAPERASQNLRMGRRDALRRAVREAGLTSCEVLGYGMTVEVEDSDFEPDALLRCGPSARRLTRGRRPLAWSKCCPRTVAQGIGPPSYLPTPGCPRSSIT